MAAAKPGWNSFEPLEADSVPPVPGWKRAMDLGGVLLLSPLLLSIGGLIALWIQCVSPGPCLLRRTRVGRRGRLFTCFQFRSRHLGAESKARRHATRGRQPGQPLDAEAPRSIPLGHFLRASGLDELPLWLNVVRGEMSIVGPRPCLPSEYESLRPWQKMRCEVPPGLTGLWQVSGKDHTFEQMVDLDIRYVQNVSLPMDARIILNTFSVLFRQTGEARSATATLGFQ